MKNSLHYPHITFPLYHRLMKENACHPPQIRVWKILLLLVTLEKAKKSFNIWWKLRFTISVARSYVPERVTYLLLPTAVTDLDTICEGGL